MGGLRVRLLGAPEFVVDGAPVEFPRGRVLAAGVVLALSAGRPVAVETIAERIWGESLPADPRGAVHTAVGRLRRLLGSQTVVRRGAGYQLDAEPDDVDVLRFERLLDEAAGTDELRLLREATALWQGEPFEPHLSDWLTLQEGPRLTDRYLTAVECRTDLELAAGVVPAGLASELRELGARHPLRESLWLRLLRVLDATGQHAAALTAYERLRRHLADELGVDPALELRQLHAGLLAGPTATEVPRQLPADLDDITGRESALRRLDELLRNDAGLVVVHGTGGVGKTTLVVHWAHRVRDEFPDGQLFVDLRGFGPGEPMAPAVALAMLLQGLGLPPGKIPEDTDARTALLRTTLAGRRVLVVLDNARDAEQVRPLLAGTGVVTLVTSRNQMRGLAAREQARRITLDRLTLADAATILLERLKDQQVEYDETSVDRLAEICGGLPLALSIAAERAGRSPGSPLRDLVRQLEDDRARLDLLETGADLGTDLRAVLSWSYRALDPDSAELFTLLGRSPSPEITAPAAAALAGIDRRTATRLLDHLVDAHLIDQTRTGRYTMHDLTRVYAAERADQDRSAASRRDALARLCSWYTWSAANGKTATQNRPWHALYGAPRDDVEPLDFQDARQALAWFGVEDRTLRAILGVASELRRYDDVIMLGQSLLYYWRYNLTPEPAEAVGATVMAAARESGHKTAEAGVLLHLSSLAFHRLGYEPALGYAERALATYRDAGDEQGACAAVGRIGLIQHRLGWFHESIATLEHAVQLAKSGGHRYAMATALNNLARVYQDSGSPGDAVRVAATAIAISRADNQRVEEAFNLDTLALALLANGDQQAAVAREEEALAIHRDLGSRWYEAFTLRQLARLHREDDVVQAYCTQGLRILDEIQAEDNDELSRADFHDLLAKHPRRQTIDGGGASHRLGQES